jgi:3'-phosphoadenosine 5'-phosphosulfate sulfotransferase (PAPS reductase)/FAD synthetase
MISQCDGLDKKFNKCYPVGDYSDKYVYKYCKLNKLPLGEYYDMGFREPNLPKGAILIYLKSLYPDCYKKVIETYPLIEATLHEV